MSQRGRKKGANGEHSKALLLLIAADEFAQNGYFETKVSTIVQKANLSQPTFYLYFKNKEAVFNELVTNFRLNLFDLTKKSRLQDGLELNSLPENIASGLAGILHFFVENENLTRIGFFISHEAEEIKRQLALHIEENLISEQQNGYFHPDLNMRMIAESLIGMLERLTVTRLFKGTIEPEAMASEIVQLLLYGMLANPTDKSI